ncbi:MAG: Zn-dependent exopeptidase M28 [Treponema sp.]|jgi:hypothetical protein|nr:Zn-dependent exopeptidase M28 [Treponema sp.]
MKTGAGRSWARESPYDRFFDFIAPDADRFTVLSGHIQKLGLNSVVFPIEGNRHFFIFPRGINLKPPAAASTGARAHGNSSRMAPPPKYSAGKENAPGGRSFPFQKKNPVILTAHYDRVSGSPGANDNSAAVFQLLGAALRLGNQSVDDWIIIFTDKEELQNGEGFQKQGSYSLAKKLRGMGLGESRIFNFDACGTGDTFVFSTTVDYLLKKNRRPGFNRASQTISRLREKVLGTARFLRFSKTIAAPTPFSDDAGFLQGGIPVQTITMLPAGEADAFAAMLFDNPGFIDMLFDGSLKNSANRKLLPETWRCLNSPSDDESRLTPEYYDKITRFAAELCRT